MIELIIGGVVGGLGWFWLWEATEDHIPKWKSFLMVLIIVLGTIMAGSNI